MQLQLLKHPIQAQPFQQFLQKKTRELAIREPAFKEELQNNIDTISENLANRLTAWLSFHFELEEMQDTPHPALIDKKKRFEEAFNATVNGTKLSLVEKLFLTYLWAQLFERLRDEAQHLSEETLRQLFHQMAKNTNQTRQTYWQRLKVSREQSD
jgi:hypothetical protein